MNKSAAGFVGSWVYLQLLRAEFDRDLAVATDDRRLLRLVILLQQLHESSGGLASVPRLELNEILSSAVQLCGFSNPSEVGEVVATIFEAIDSQNVDLGLGN
jgi:hypothetical protein